MKKNFFNLLQQKAEIEIQSKKIETTFSLYSKLNDYKNAEEAASIVDNAGLGEWNSIKLSKLYFGLR